MNHALIDPFILAQDCPEVLQGFLQNGHATCIRFNHGGDFLASGRLSGTIVIFDIETFGVARKLRGHTRQIQSLSWSRCDRYLLSASQEWKCVLWDLKHGTKIRVIRFETLVFIAELHPRSHLHFVAALLEDQPVLVDLTRIPPVKHKLPSTPKRSESEARNISEKQIAQDAKNTTTVTIFTENGRHILAGTNKGWLNVIETRTCKLLYSLRVCSKIIVLLRLTKTGRDMLVNSTDRIIRTYQLPYFDNATLDWGNLHVEVEHKFQDLVNRLSWNHVTFSFNGEYLAASTWMNHDIYVWERGLGSLVKILEGPKEELSAVEWHPQKPMVAAVGVDSGRVYVWSILTPQKWSALAPDFGEIEENIEYVEREDEFDILPIEQLHQQRLDAEDEMVDVLTFDDSVTLDSINEVISSDEEDKEADLSNDNNENDDSDTIIKIKEDRVKKRFKIPVLLDIQGCHDSEDEEIISIGAGQFRCKTLTPRIPDEMIRECKTIIGLENKCI